MPSWFPLSSFPPFNWMHFKNCEHDEFFLTQNELNWVWFGCFCYLLSETACGITSQSWKLQAPGMSLIGCIIFHFSWPIHLGRAKVRSRSRRCTYWFREGETEMIALWHNQSVKRFYPVLFVWHYFFKELHPPSQTAVFIIPASGLYISNSQSELRILCQGNSFSSFLFIKICFLKGLLKAKPWLFQSKLLF